MESSLFSHSHTFMHFSEIPVTRSTHFIGVPNTTLPMAKTLHNVLGCAVGLVSADETPEFRAAAAEVIRGVRFNILVQVGGRGTPVYNSSRPSLLIRQIKERVSNWLVLFKIS